MGLPDVAGVFSRFFIVGFFLPSFFALVALAQLCTSAFVPDGLEEYSGATQILILSGLGLLVGLFLLGLHRPILRLFEGYPALQSRVGRPFISLQRRAYEKLAEQKRGARPEADSETQSRGIAAWRRLDRYFPDDPSRLLPTRFGNVLRAWEDYSYNRWGLDAIPFWARVEPLLSEQEQRLHEDARTDVAFFVNSSLAALVVGIVLVGDGITNTPIGWAWAWLYLLPFLFAYLIYRFAIDAGQRWGVEIKASLDLHRLEVYDRLGVRRPASFSEERSTIAPALNRFLLYAKPLPDELWAERPSN
jgi:branched-subunit amino acid transport protein